MSRNIIEKKTLRSYAVARLYVKNMFQINIFALSQAKLLSLCYLSALHSPKKESFFGPFVILIMNSK